MDVFCSALVDCPFVRFPRILSPAIRDPMLSTKQFCQTFESSNSVFRSRGINGTTDEVQIALHVLTRSQPDCGHYHKIVEITDNAGSCLEKEYMVTEPSWCSCSTPRKRPFNIPSMEM